MKFEELGIQQSVCDALAKLGIKEATSIQEKAIPAAKKGQDVIGISKTGSGKTFAFGLPLLERVDGTKRNQALVLAPTRELAVQISRELTKISGAAKLRIATIYGGVSINPQIDELRHSHIVVGTPGRILDHLERRTLQLENINMFVLDEADKMVEMGFIEDVERILRSTPKNRQIMLFGATISDEVENIKRNHMNNVFIAKAETQVKEEYLEQFYFDLQPKDKFSLLVHLLRTEEMPGTIVFCSTRDTVDIVTANLHKNKVRAEKIHGKLSQAKRQRIIDDFNAGKANILVASTVAARGLHIEGLTHVINYDLPKDPQEYIHRIGRTARAGLKGKAYTLLTPRDYPLFDAILRRYPVKINKMDKPEFERLSFDARAARRDDRRGGHGSREGRFGKPQRGHRSRHEREEFHRSPRPASAVPTRNFEIGSNSWRSKEW